MLVRLEVVEHLSYAVEKGRLRAIAERLPTSDQVVDYNEPNRRVAQLVTPAVVHIETIQYISPLGILDFAASERSGKLREGFGDAHPWMQEGNASDEGEAAEGGSLDEGGAVDSRDDMDRIPVQSGLGSGFIFDAANGFVLTNQHVVAGADRIDVILSDGRRREGIVVGADEATDLAVLQIRASRLHELGLGDSDALGVGDEVFALGNPFGLDGTFSRGIVSAMGRSIGIRNVRYQGFIQTDAVINPGNSGGPLVDRRGEVIGVNTAIASDTGSYMGVGFAIPSNRVALLLPHLLKGGEIVRGFLGVATVDVRLNREEAADLGWSRPNGVLIRQVLDNTPVAEAGLRADDILLEVNGTSILNTAVLMDAVAFILPGTEVTLRYFRGGEVHEMAVVVARRPSGA